MIKISSTPNYPSQPPPQYYYQSPPQKPKKNIGKIFVVLSILAVSIYIFAFTDLLKILTTPTQTGDNPSNPNQYSQTRDDSSLSDNEIIALLLSSSTVDKSKTLMQLNLYDAKDPRAKWVGDYPVVKVTIDTNFINALLDNGVEPTFMLDDGTTWRFSNSADRTGKDFIYEFIGATMVDNKVVSSYTFLILSGTTAVGISGQYINEAMAKDSGFFHYYFNVTWSGVVFELLTYAGSGGTVFSGISLASQTGLLNLFITGQATYNFYSANGSSYHYWDFFLIDAPIYTQYNNIMDYGIIPATYADPSVKIRFTSPAWLYFIDEFVKDYNLKFSDITYTLSNEIWRTKHNILHFVENDTLIYTLPINDFYFDTEYKAGLDWSDPYHLPNVLMERYVGWQRVAIIISSASTLVDLETLKQTFSAKTTAGFYIKVTSSYGVVQEL